MFTTEKDENVLQGVKPSACQAPDDVSPILLRNYASTLDDMLRKVRIESFSKSKLPEAWKNPVVIPIYKKGGKHLAVN